jgi:hypothetical protein
MKVNSKSAAKMKKDAAIFFRVSEEIKKATEKMARMDDRTVAAWVHKTVVDRLRELGAIK